MLARSTHAGTDAAPMPGLGAKDAQMHVLPVPLSLLTGISALRISVPADLRPEQARRAALETVRVRREPQMPRARCADSSAADCPHVP